MISFLRISGTTFAPFASPLDKLLIENVELLSDYYQLVADSNIIEVDTRANALFSNASKLFLEKDKLFSNYDLFKSLAIKEDNLLQQFSFNIENVTVDGESAKAQFINGIRETISEIAEDADVTAEEIYNKIKSSGKYHVDFFEEASDNFDNIAFDTCMSSFRFGLNLFKLHAFLEGQQLVSSYPQDALLLTHDVASMEEMSTHLNGKVSNNYTLIHKSLLDEVAIEHFRNLIFSCTNGLMAILYNASKMLGQFNYLANRSIVNGGSPNEIYQSSLLLSQTINILITHIMYLEYAKLKLTSHNAGSWYGGEKRRVDSREYDFNIESGTPTSISNALQMTGDSGLLEIEGIVEDIYIADDQYPPKFSTFVLLGDGASHTIKLRAHMHSLINNGVFKGSYCKVNGVLVHAASWLSTGEIGMDIDRFSLVEKARKSWLADIAHRMKPYYALYPDEMNMIFTP